MILMRVRDPFNALQTLLLCINHTFVTLVISVWLFSYNWPGSICEVQYFSYVTKSGALNVSVKRC